MKRSEINKIIKTAKSFFAENKFILPPFGFWDLETWKKTDKETIFEIIDNSLGWDITDFGFKNFWKTGICIFTLRNGSQLNIKKGKGKTYAEKIFFLEVNQNVPLHTHDIKIEDVINRGGGNLGVQLYNSKQDGSLDQTSINLSKDGKREKIPAGEKFYLKPGESINLEPGVYHRFWGEEKKVLVGEVSLANDDIADNKFLKQVGRFPAIDEDEEPLHLLCSDYPKYLSL